jgi:hypothetical protein
MYRNEVGEREGASIINHKVNRVMIEEVALLTLAAPLIIIRDRKVRLLLYDLVLSLQDVSFNEE